jgi:peroxiredoxin
MTGEKSGRRVAPPGGPGTREPRAEWERQAGRYRLGASAPLRLCGLLLFVSFLFSGFSAAVAGTGTDPLQALGLQAPNEAVAAPEFSLSDLAGKKVQLKAFRGKLVLLNFFATWCDPCREEMPGMERLFRAHQDNGFVVLAVNLQESAKTVRPFVQQLKLSFPTVLDSEGSVSRDYGVRALPVSFLIGRDGNIRWRAIGGRDWESAQARRYFAQLVSEKK